MYRVPETYHEFCLFGVAFAVCCCGAGEFRDEGFAAVGEVGAVGLDVGDYGVDLGGGVGECAGCCYGLGLAGGEGVGEEGASLLLLLLGRCSGVVCGSECGGGGGGEVGCSG